MYYTADVLTTTETEDGRALTACLPLVLYLLILLLIYYLVVTTNIIFINLTHM